MVKNIEKVASRSIVAGGVLLLAVAAAPSATAHITANPDTTAGGGLCACLFRRFAWLRRVPDHGGQDIDTRGNQLCYSHGQSGMGLGKGDRRVGGTEY